MEKFEQTTSSEKINFQKLDEALLFLKDRANNKINVILAIIFNIADQNPEIENFEQELHLLSQEAAFHPDEYNAEDFFEKSLTTEQIINILQRKQKLVLDFVNMLNKRLPEIEKIAPQKIEAINGVKKQLLDAIPLTIEMLKK